MTRKMIPGLVHAHAGMQDADFFEAIDAAGGWPLGFAYAGFEHSDTRDAGFTNWPVNDGWWTIVASADDYLLWKLSPAGLQRVVEAVRSAIRIPNINAATLHIRNSRGYRASVSTKPDPATPMPAEVGPRDNPSRLPDSLGLTLEDALTGALKQRGYRTDGDLLALAQRCHLMAREDGDLINMQKALIARLEDAS